MATELETRLVMTPKISEFLNKILSDGSSSRCLKMKIRIALMKPEDKEHTIQYDVLKEAHDFYYEFRRPMDGVNEVLLHELVQDSRVFVENVPEPVRSPELVKRLNRLRAEQEQREYNAMVENVAVKRRAPGAEVGQAVRSTSKQMMSIVNFLLSVAATAAFGFVSSKYAFSENLGIRIIFSVVLASVVALAELYFMARTEI